MITTTPHWTEEERAALAAARAAALADRPGPVTAQIAAASAGRLLTGEEERALARAYRDGDAHARDLLVERNVRMAWHRVVRWRQAGQEAGLEEEDLYQEALDGLRRAVEGFDPDRALKFSTYATSWVEQRIRRAIDNGGAIRLPVHMRQRGRDISRADSALATRLGRAPTAAEIGAEIGLDPTKVVDAWATARRAAALSLDRPVPGADADDERTLLHVIPDRGQDVAGEVLARERRETLAGLLATLQPRLRQIVALRYGLGGDGEPRTLAEVGEQVGLTRERVRQLEAEALDILRQAARPYAAAAD